MDIVQQCLSLTPVPYLAPAWSILRFIYSSVEQAQASKQQLQALAQTIAQLLWTLNREYFSGQLLYENTSTTVDDLGRFVIITLPYILVSYQCISHRLLDEISEFVQKEVTCSFLKLLSPKVKGLLGLSNTTSVSRLRSLHFRQVVTPFAALSNNMNRATDIPHLTTRYYFVLPKPGKPRLLLPPTISIVHCPCSSCTS